MAFDVVGKAKVIIETVVDEADAKKAGKETGKAVADGVGDAGSDAGDTFGTNLASILKAKGPALAASAGAAIGVAVVGGFVENFERDASGKKLVASLGLDGKEAAELNATASNIYKDAWGESFEEVQQGVAATKSSFRDLDGEELRKAAEAAQIFSDIFGVDVVQAAGTASVAVKQGLAKDAVEAFDLMTAAAQEVPIQFRDELQDAVTEYSSFFAGLGLDGQETFGILSAAADQGAIGIDKAGDAIKEFGIRATDASTSTSDAFHTLQLDQEQLQRDLLAGGDAGAEAFNKIVQAISDIEDPATRAQTAIALFGTPLEDLTVQQIPEFLQALLDGKGGLKDFNGALKEAGDTASDSATPKLDAFIRHLKEDFLGGLEDVVVATEHDVTAIESALNRLGGFADSVGNKDGKFQVSDILGGPLANFLGYNAGGTRNYKGGFSVVGEQGPEIMYLPQGANVYNHQESLRMAQPAGNQSVVINNVFNGPTTGSERKREVDWTMRYGLRYGVPSNV